MRRIIGVCCVVVGVLCILSAVGLIVYNNMEEKSAEVASDALLEHIQNEIENVSSSLQEQEQQENPSHIYEELPAEMGTVLIDGYECIGVLSIPVLELKLPVLTDWSYDKLKAAPCHYYGSCYSSDFVIAGHNYTVHFGRISELAPGDVVVFTDVGGVAHEYEVVLTETLIATATGEMISSGFDLSLYTCTTGGGSRVTVRCSSIEK